MTFTTGVIVFSRGRDGERTAGATKNSTKGIGSRTDGKDEEGTMLRMEPFTKDSG